MEVTNLERRVRRRRRRGWLLALGAALAALGGLAALAGYVAWSRLRYAELDREVAVRRDAVDPRRLDFVYRPLSAGQVVFRRESADRTTELLSRVVPEEVTSEQRFEWRLGGIAAGDPLQVTYRRGWRLVRQALVVPAADSTPVLGQGVLAGRVVSATTGDAVSGARVRVVGTSLSAVADRRGEYRIDGAPTGEVRVEVSADGYTTDQSPRTLAAGEEAFALAALSPGLKEGQVRIVLTWNGEPSDLDAHLEGPLPEGEQFHVYYHQQGDLHSKEYVRLDVDARDGYGPETLTVLGVLPGTYRYFVHDYTHRNAPANTGLGHSGAEVRVYQGGQTYRFHARPGAAGNLWDVCKIEVTAAGAAVQRVDRYQGLRLAALGLYDKRTLADRGEWIGRYGGSLTSEEAVGRGLEWLARHQADDGSWSDYCLGTDPRSRCDQDAPCREPGGRYEAGLSGLPILAFQAGGHYYFNRNRYSAHVRRGLDALVDLQRHDGSIRGTKASQGYTRFPRNYMYEHGIATFALADACATAAASGEDPDTRYLEAMQRAVAFIFDQQYHDGGWRYSDDKSGTGDTSVSGWQVLALKSAREAGVELPEEPVERIRDFFHARATRDRGRTGYLSSEPAGDAMTGIGMFVRQFLLDEGDDPLVYRAAGYLAELAERHWNGTHFDRDQVDYYLWYNCTLGMFQAGGAEWERWNPIVRDAVIALQKREGCERGSWDPVSSFDAEGGRIYTTALAILTLEIYYRYTSPADQQAGSFPLRATGPSP